MSLTTISDFATLLKTILDAGTWTNHAVTPGITIVGDKNRRYNTDKGVQLFNGLTTTELASDGTPILRRHSGTIVAHHNNQINRGKMGADIYNILKDSGYPYSIITDDFTDNKRNNKEVRISIEIIEC